MNRQRPQDLLTLSMLSVATIVVGVSGKRKKVRMIFLRVKDLGIRYT